MKTSGIHNVKDSQNCSISPAEIQNIGYKISVFSIVNDIRISVGKDTVLGKKIIIGAIAYLLSPFDGMPDLTPVIGFTDDLGVISFGLVAIACYIDEDVRTKAREKIHKLFKDIDDKELEAVDAKL
ncbi:MAG: DUF1232 domain-containing protein [Saprospiraceae bacterium]|nr:DUF1232 domain-containing protein [Saprospiraceae bacterium]